MYACVHTVYVLPQGQVFTVLSSSQCDGPMPGPNAFLLTAATESSTVMEKEVARLEQVNKDAKAACQSLQATVDNLSR